MSEIAGLIRQFPEGSFFLLLALIWACERIGVSFVNRNKPTVQCDCDCCGEEWEEDEEEK